MNGSSTGYYGNLTKNAVKKYQRDNNIPATGNIFEKTLGQLKKHFCENNLNQEAPKNCKVWFDGCNTCSRSVEGGPMMCTLMACLTSKMIPSCKEYFATSTASTTLIKVCPTEKITNMMPVMCIKAPCPAQPRDSYYIYNGVRYEIDKFDADYVKNNCTVKDIKVY